MNYRELGRTGWRVVNFFDTADVYGGGHSERLLAQLKREHDEEIIVATKVGRRLDPHIADGYNAENLSQFIERSLKNLEVDALDLLQLHCSPTEVYYPPEVFAALDDLVKQGKLRYYGVSVEHVEEALSQFAPDDHRAFNRHGEAFDRGETFSGVGLPGGFAGCSRAART